VGCGYKYLNGGPGAPAFVWAHPRHADRFWQPLAGWMGHAAPFEFTPGYRPAAGIARYLCGTPAVLGMAALECGVDTVLAAEPLGGMAALRAKSLALTTLFARWWSALRRPGLQRGVAARRRAARLQVCLARPEGAYAIVQALIARGVIGDFRAGDGAGHARHPALRLHAAVHALRRRLGRRGAPAPGAGRGEWRQPRFNQRHAVT
jgi:kynureninase